MTPGRREALILAAAGLAAAAAGFLLGPLLLGRRDRAAETGFMALQLPDLQGRTRRISEWRGRVLVCNFWATWCAPCREEIPLLMAARSKYAAKGVEIVGIAIDNAAKVGEFSRSLRISYPILLSEAEGLEHMRGLGNTSGGLPYTVFFDRDGRVAHRKLGALKQADLEAILAPLVGE
jgi:thiol-disulfide isomerase/thioredoxin